MLLYVAFRINVDIYFTANSHKTYLSKITQTFINLNDEIYKPVYCSSAPSPLCMPDAEDRIFRNVLQAVGYGCCSGHCNEWDASRDAD